MSRTYNKHDKSWNYPKREAKFRSKKNRRTYGKRLVSKFERFENSDDIDLAIDVGKNEGHGDIWNYAW